MKFIIIASLVFGTSALAVAADNPKFNEHKQKVLKEMDEELAAIQAAKSCFSAANDHNAMKMCHETLAKERKHMRDENIDEKIHELQEKKAKMDKSK